MPKPCLALLLCQQFFISASKEEARMGFLERRWAEEETLVKNGIMVSNLSPNTRSIRVLWFKLKLTCTSLTSSVLPQELGS